MTEARPWHLLNKNKWGWKELQQYRYDICKKCPQFISATKQCKQCGCIMSAKTWLLDAYCPLEKWGSVDRAKINEDE